MVNLKLREVVCWFAPSLPQIVLVQIVITVSSGLILELTESQNLCGFKIEFSDGL
jgi:hypothetical protein